MTVRLDQDWTAFFLEDVERDKLAVSGRGALPMIRPPAWPWPDVGGGVVPDIRGTIPRLLMEAHRWGVPVGSPLCLDLAGIGDEIAAPQADHVHGYLVDVREAWKHWCVAAGRFLPWVRGYQRHMQDIPTQRCWLLLEEGEPDVIPAGYAAAGDLAVNGQTWMATDLDGLVVLSG